MDLVCDLQRKKLYGAQLKMIFIKANAHGSTLGNGWSSSKQVLRRRRDHTGQKKFLIVFLFFSLHLTRSVS